MIAHLSNSTALCRHFISLPFSSSYLRPVLSPSRYRRAMSFSSLHKMEHQPLKAGDCFEGQKGRIYTVQELLSERKECDLYVYKTTADGKSFVAKSMMPGEYEYQKDLQTPLHSCPNLRVLEDGNPELDLFVYSYLETNALQGCRTLDKGTKKNLLRVALTGLAALHERNIIHTDIKPNNVLIDREEIDGVTILKKVQLSDLEDSVILPLGKYLRDGRCGNQFWRSPESWAKAAQGTQSDIFSFGIVSIYVMLNKMVFYIADKEVVDPDSWEYILRRHISYFGNDQGLKGLLKWIGEENPFFDRLIELAGTFGPGNLREPFEKWHFVDESFRDLIGRMTNLDPSKRITAKEALEHPWFSSDRVKKDRW